jgi:hypothetical protein
MPAIGGMFPPNQSASACIRGIRACVEGPHASNRGLRRSVEGVFAAFIPRETATRGDSIESHRIRGKLPNRRADCVPGPPAGHTHISGTGRA